jgi:formylglycine-generating enzyme required for sulfatase activity
MGSPKNETERGFNGNYEEQAEVRLTKGFWLAKYEATQGQWERVMGPNLIQQLDVARGQSRWEADNPDADGWWDKNQLRSRPPRRAKSPGESDFGEGPNYPMYYVNHLEATDFCLKLTAQERKAGRLPPGWEYRLPTEAQWEYACRAGTKTATAFGDRLSSTEANFDGSSPYNGAAPGPKLGRTQPVGSYRPNAWGLCDMHGNAWEWCRDWEGRPLGGTDPEIKYGDLTRMVRGGGWRAPGKLCRSASRIPHRWSSQDFETGFRVSIVQLDPQPKPAPEPMPNPTPLPPGILVNSIGMRLAPIPAGKFLMGSPVDEPYRPWMGRDEADYEEQHPVTIREPFYLGVYLVTQGQYEQIMGGAPGYKPSYFSHEGGGKDKVQLFKDTKQFPRETVGWEDAQEFCRRLSDLPEEKKLGRVYRLPTEQEWEYACRAGTSTPYYLGNTISPQQANIAETKLGRTTPVGQFSHNKFGLYDMHGNLLEWCQGLYAPYQEDLKKSRHRISPCCARRLLGRSWRQRSLRLPPGGRRRRHVHRVPGCPFGWRTDADAGTTCPRAPTRCSTRWPITAGRRRRYGCSGTAIRTSFASAASAAEQLSD